MVVLLQVPLLLSLVVVAVVPKRDLSKGVRRMMIRRLIKMKKTGRSKNWS